MKLSIGIDIGGTSIKSSLVSEEGKIVEELSSPIISESGAEKIFQSLQKICDFFLKKYASLNIQTIGIGTPGRVSLKKGCVIEGAYQLPGWKDFPFVERLSASYRIPVFTDNDGNLMSYGEFRFGAGKGAKNAICITLGTGIGGGIIIDKKLYRGSFEYAGEVGHMVIHPQGRLCNCGSLGCWEAYASATGLFRDAREKKFFVKKESINDVKDIFKAQSNGDPKAKELITNYIQNLSAGIINLIRIFDTEIFVIGGGISSAKEELFEPLLIAIKKLSRKDSRQNCLIKPAELGNKAGIMGSAIFALDSLRKDSK